MIPLQQISVPNPCPAQWDAMQGNAQTRFCTGCRKNVYNLSEMSRVEGEDLLTRTDAGVCVFFHPDADGTPLPREDVPPAFRPSVWRRAWAAALSGLAAVVLAALGGGAQAAPTTHGKAASDHGAKPGVRRRLMGKVVRHAPPKAPNVLLGGKPIAPRPPLLGGAPALPRPRPTGGEPVMLPPPPHK